MTKGKKITQSQKEIIIRWRWMGLSYRAIGKEIGLSHTTIRTYCQKEKIK